ncbi:MAG: bacillithiol biosynthesis deacetylase BshB1, partial [Parafilimonas sp.]
FDVSSFHEKKIEAILCYTSQFSTGLTADSSEPETYISTPDFIEIIKARAFMLGKRIGVKYAEGYISAKMLGVKSFDAFIQNVT